MLAFKDGVRLNFDAPAIRHMIDVLEEASQTSAVRQCLLYGDLTITSGNDSQHAKDSRHYRDEAIDLRTHNIRTAKRGFLREYLEAKLNGAWPGKFRVLHEYPNTDSEHLHVQVTKGETFP